MSCHRNPMSPPMQVLKTTEIDGQSWDLVEGINAPDGECGCDNCERDEICCFPHKPNNPHDICGGPYDYLVKHLPCTGAKPQADDVTCEEYKLEKEE